MERKKLRAYVLVRNYDNYNHIEDFEDFNIEDYKKYKSDNRYIYAANYNSGFRYWLYKSYNLLEFIIDNYEILTEEEIKTLLEDIDFNKKETYHDGTIYENSFSIEKACKCPLIMEKINHDLMLQYGELDSWFSINKEYIKKLGVKASDEIIEKKIKDW